jgi:hypothetical protein
MYNQSSPAKFTHEMNIPMINITNGSERRTRNLLLLAIRRILKPLIRLLLDNDIKYNMMLEELKRVYVSVADEEFKLGNKPQTDSRITLLTGVHRKDVRRLRSANIDAQPETRNLSLTSQVIGQWLRNPSYLDENNNPLPLPRLASAGGERSFEALVANISKDFRARPVLDEWLNLGVVNLDEQDRVHLDIKAFIPNQDIDEKLFYLSMNVHDHLATAVNNVDPKNSPFLERCVYYYGLTPENIEKLHEAAKEAGMHSMAVLNRLAITLKAEQSKQAKSIENQTLKRMNFGVYFHSSAEEIKTDMLSAENKSKIEANASAIHQFDRKLN